MGIDNPELHWVGVCSKEWVSGYMGCRGGGGVMGRMNGIQCGECQ